MSAPIILVTGVMASGKSTVAASLADTFEQGVHLRGDTFRKMIVRGRADMTPEPSESALGQLRLRYRAAASVASRYSHAGFTVVYQDTILGSMLSEVVELYRDCPLHVVVLRPSAEIVAQREASRQKQGYLHFDVASLQAVLATTPNLGLWIDNSDQSVDETCQAINRAMHASRIAWS